MAKRTLNPLKALSVTELSRELLRRRRTLPGLIAKRRTLAAKLAKLDEQIAGLGGEALAPARASSSRAGRKARVGTLKDVVAKVLADGKMGIAEIITAVNKAGYVSDSKYFRTMVTLALSDKNAFKRVDRGVYARA